jgi:hypothetical protein
VLKRIFGPKRDEMTRDWKKLLEGKHNTSYPLPNIIRMIKSMGWVEQAASMQI